MVLLCVCGLQAAATTRAETAERSVSKLTADLVRWRFDTRGDPCYGGVVVVLASVA